jgi:peptide deformylase
MKLITDLSLLQQPSKECSSKDGQRIAHLLKLTLENLHKHGSRLNVIAAPCIGIFRRVIFLKKINRVLINPRIVASPQVKIAREEKFYLDPRRCFLIERAPWIEIATANMPEKLTVGPRGAIIWNREEVAECGIVQQMMDLLNGRILGDRNRETEVREQRPGEENDHQKNY